MPEPPLNPYDAPASAPAEPPSGTVSLPDGPYGPYRDNRLLSRWVLGGLGLHIAFAAFWAVVNLLYGFSTAAATSPTLGRIVEVAEQVSWSTLVTFVLFGTWIVRSGKNTWLLHQLRRRIASQGGERYHETLETTPGWCVGWYFIPIANLWKPFVAMREMFRVSSVREPAPGYLLPFWWALWLVSDLGDSVTRNDRLFGTDSWDEMVVTIVWVSSSGLSLALGVIAIQLVRTLTRLQHDAALHFSAIDPELLKPGDIPDRLTGSFLDR